MTAIVANKKRLKENTKKEDLSSYIVYFLENYL